MTSQQWHRGGDLRLLPGGVLETAAQLFGIETLSWWRFQPKGHGAIRSVQIHPGKPVILVGWAPTTSGLTLLERLQQLRLLSADIKDADLSGRSCSRISNFIVAFTYHTYAKRASAAIELASSTENAFRCGQVQNACGHC